MTLIGEWFVVKHNNKSNNGDIQYRKSERNENRVVGKEKAFRQINWEHGTV